MLALYGRYESVLCNQFRSDPAFAKVFREACHTFVQATPPGCNHSNAEFICSYCDTLLAGKRKLAEVSA